MSMDRFDFVNRANADYIEALYERYLKDPRGVDETWQAFFAGFELAGGRGFERIPTSAAAAAPVDVAGDADLVPGASMPSNDPRRPRTLGIHNLVHSYRELGHAVATLDPLGHNRPDHPLLQLSQFNVTDADLDRTVGGGSFLGHTNGTLRDLIAKLRETYCGTIGVEFMDINDKTQRDWLLQQMEPALNNPQFTPDQSRSILFQLIAAEEFERFLATRFVGAKRFGLEGAEALVPLMNTLVDEGAKLGVEEVCMGMPHRGRLNVLAHVLNKPYEVIFSEFEGTIKHESDEGDGDVKYHLGYANDRPVAGKNQSIHLSLSPNPSHLELINPIVEGIVRAKQKIRGDRDHSKVVPVLLHGDAAFVGQGIVPETLSLSELMYYRTGGTVHVIVNNQIGFTTPPKEGRFTLYPTDVAKAIQAPIFHVNGDDPEAVVHAARLAIAFREQFRVDVIIDLVCYRRNGHNEVDEPSFTQPVMYKEIAAHKSVRELYQERIIAAGKIDPATVDNMRKICKERMEAAADLAHEVRPRQRTATVNNLWKGMVKKPTDWTAVTKVSKDVLLRVAEAATRAPEGFTPHPKLKRLMATRLEAVKNGKGIDWGNGEMLAFGSLLLEGTPVRFTGQDVQRGTFSHRHAVLNDYNTGEPYTPLNFIDEKNQASLTIVNTMLSELAVLGFEYGFSSGDPRNLVCWEAQFGDFVNGAQPVIDQFIVAAESKWGLQNGLVLLLPHGFEGQGPEHSNAYLERFLTLCAEDNIQVCVPTTPAQNFHMLRRQIHRKFRKPLVVMSPKSLLRYEPASSTVEEFTDGAFQNVLDDPANLERDSVKRILFCSGKVYYTLAQARDKEGLKDTAVVRVEQLYPFPKKELQAVLAKYRQAREVCWVQEEPKNRGAWAFIEPRLSELLPDPVVLTYVGRDEAASPATGSLSMHKIEEAELVGQALEIVSGRSAAAAPASGGNGSGAAGTPAPASPAPPSSAAAAAAASAPATASSQTPVSD
jgi:2-oxoglutarate dehydrogenase E1 component